MMILLSTRISLNQNNQKKRITFKYGNKKISKLIPYYYRRTALFIEKENEIKKYLISIYDQLNPKKYKKWEEEQEKLRKKAVGEEQRLKSKVLSGAWKIAKEKAHLALR